MELECPQTGDQCLESLFANYPDLRLCKTEILVAYDLLTGAFRSGAKLLICGNGGSAADAEHIVGELMKSFRFKRPVDSNFLESYRRVNGDEAPSWLEGFLRFLLFLKRPSLRHSAMTRTP